MCVTCGCNGDEKTTLTNEHGEQITLTQQEHEHTHEHPHTHDHTHTHEHTHAHTHEHPHDHTHAHTHEHPHDHTHTHAHIHEHPNHSPQTATPKAPNPQQSEGLELHLLERRVLDKNDRIAERNRGFFAGRGVFALNLMSSPGAGKTCLLERTLREIGQPCAVIEGDQATSFDAEQIRATGTPAIQVNTGKGCHLEAEMISAAIPQLPLQNKMILFIENVGNLVCPSLFDLGEHKRIVLMSVTEGENKPLKYPHIFRSADVVLLTKIDLLPHLDYDLPRAIDAIRTIQPDATILQVSARSGQGMADWYDWLRQPQT